MLRLLKAGIGACQSLCWEAITDVQESSQLQFVSDLPCLIKVIGRLSYSLYIADASKPINSFGKKSFLHSQQ